MPGYVGGEAIAQFQFFGDGFHVGVDVLNELLLTVHVA
jgi:hypothetical protein